MLAISLALALAPLTDWHVDVNAAAPGSGTLAAPYASIEYAIAQPATLAGDRILVQAGTYTGETIDFLGKELSIEAAQGPGTVTVMGPYAGMSAHLPGSGGQALIRVVNGEGVGTQIVGIDFTLGAGEDRGTDAVGGALYMVGSELALVDCQLEGFAEHRGGAAYLENSTLVGTRTLFEGRVRNPAPSVGSHLRAGGALWAENSTITMVDCEVQGRVNFTPDSDSIHAFSMWLDFCDTTLTTTSIDVAQACQFDCLPNSLLHVLQGNLTMQDCDWTGGNMGNAHTVLGVDATLSFEGMTWDLGGGLNHGRALAAQNSDTLIRNCQFLNSLGQISDFSPFSNASGGQISHSGLLVIEDSLFHGNRHTSGGAISADTLEVRDSTFTNNIARPGWVVKVGHGGAILAHTANLVNCTFDGNEVNSSSVQIGQSDHYPNRGGSLYLSGPSTIRNCTFSNGHLGRFGHFYDLKRGGAIYAEAPIRIFDCEFTGNVAEAEGLHPDGSYTQGGALYLEQGGYLEGCTFTGNAVLLSEATFAPWPYFAQGGAVFAESGILAISDCLFANNEAEQGAGIFAAPQAQVSATRSLWRSNTLVEYPPNAQASSGAAWVGPLAATQCTIVDHDVASMSAEVIEGGSLDSCILWNNAPGTLPAGVSATYSTVEGGAPGIGNSAEDPLFWASDDFQLLPASPAIDAGNPALFDDNGTRADQGAFVFDPTYCSVLCAVELGTQPCASNPNCLGVVSEIAAYGSATVADQFLTLAATQVPEPSIGYFLTSESGGFVPLFNGSMGNLCVGGSIYRMHDEVLIANSGNRVGRRVDLNNLAYGNVVLPGSSWHFQFWYRDFACASSSTNTSGSVRVQF